MGTRQQTDNSCSNTGALSICAAFNNNLGFRCIMQDGGTAGVLSSVVNVSSAGIGLVQMGSFGLPDGDPNTATWAGSCVMRWNITTANTNVTWSQLLWSAFSASGAFRVCVTRTVGLAISLGTTGVKTASVGVATFAANLTDVTRLHMAGTNAAMAASPITFLKDQLVTVPFTATVAASTAPIHSLAILNNGT